MKLSIITLLFPALALGACAVTPVAPDGDPAAISSAVDTGEAASIVFDAAWGETTRGSLVAGGTFSVQYDPARLPTCRDWHNEYAVWNITAYARFWPGGTQVQADIMRLGRNPDGTLPYPPTWVAGTPSMSIPAGTTDIEMWFKNETSFDLKCTAWDSDYGRNYRFRVDGPPPRATVAFGTDWSNVATGTLARGGQVTVKYDPARLVNIAQARVNGGSTYFQSRYHCYGYVCCSFDYATHLNYRFSPNTSFKAVGIDGGTAVLNIPSDAVDLEVYFDADVARTTWQCPGGGYEGPKTRQPDTDRFYDSNYGRNFVYGLR